MTNFWLKRQYAETSTEPDGLAKRGYIYLLAEFFEIPDAATVYFGLSTNGTSIEFQFYDLVTSLHPVKAQLIENPTCPQTPSAIVGRNLYRTGSDTHTVTFWTAASYTGGTKIASELVGAGSKAGGAAGTSRIHVLAPETHYLMSFQNTGNQPTTLHLNLGWSEGEPGARPLWTS